MIRIFIILAQAAMFGGAIVIPSSHTYRNTGLDNKLFTENVVFESAVSNDMQCARLCSQHDDCQSFTFASTVCRGHSLLVTSNPSSSVYAAGAQTFDVNECASGPCQNGGSCVDQVNGYTCNCQAGYTGSLCDTDVNECASGHCQNGGSCVDQVNGYTCNCQAGYTGIRCETDVDECASDPCQNGSCVDQVNGYTCNCQAGYTGSHCETDVDECASRPCQNGGSCVDHVNGNTCYCPAGYTGTQCETESGLYKNCTTDNDCVATNMSCYSGQCLCGGGYFFSNSQSVCVQNCSHYDDSYLHYKHWDLMGHDAESLEMFNSSTCASFCNQRATCVLFSYVPGHGACYLKEVTPQDFPGDWRPTHRADAYQRTCA